MPYRFSAKHAFVTFPQCDVPKETVLRRITSNFTVDWAVVSHERHADGESHLHAVIRFSKLFTSTDSGFLDLLADKHGDYRSARSVKNVLKYVRKDGDFVEHGNPPTATEASESGRVAPSSRAAAILVAGGAPSDVLKEEPGFYITHRSHVLSLHAELSAARQIANLSTWNLGDIGRHLSVPTALPQCAFRLPKWLDDNLNRPREFKQKQLWLHGGSGVGKTHFLNHLTSMLATYYIPPDEEFYDFYADGKFKLSILDEFKAQKRIVWLNMWLQGSVMPLRLKGAQLLKHDNLPTIIVSNYTPRQCFHKADEMALVTLENRLEVIEMSLIHI